MRKAIALAALFVCVILLGGFSLFADRPSSAPEWPASVTFRNLPGDGIVSGLGYTSFSGSVFGGTGATGLGYGDLSFWTAPQRKLPSPVGVLPVPITFNPDPSGCNYADPSFLKDNQWIYEPLTSYVRGIVDIQVGATVGKPAEFYMAMKSSNPYCLLFGAHDRVKGTDCSTMVMVTRNSRTNWTVSTVEGSNDIAMMAWNTTAPPKNRIGLKQMPFGLTVDCPTCPCPSGSNCQ